VVVSLNLESGGEISGATSQTGRGGNVSVHANGSILVDSAGRLTVQSTGSGDAGDIEMSGSRITLRRGAEVSAQALGAGGGGTIEILAVDALRLGDRVRVSARTAGEKPGGSIELSAKEIRIGDGSQVSARSDGRESAGSISLLARDSIDLDHASITTAAPNSDGNIALRARAHRAEPIRDHRQRRRRQGREHRYRSALRGHERQPGRGTGGRRQAAASHHRRAVRAVGEEPGQRELERRCERDGRDQRAGLNPASELSTLSESHLDARS
jgi:hypothetical protein